MGRYFDLALSKGAVGPVAAQLAEIAPLSGATNPTTSTVGAVKQMYLNTATGDVFICTAATGGVYTWSRKVNGGSMSLIETITLTEDVNTVTPANIGNNIYDELLIEYVGTASIDTPTLQIKNAANAVVAQYSSLSVMTSTRYVRIRILRAVLGAGALMFSMGNSNSSFALSTESSIFNPSADAAGIAGFALAFTASNVFKTGGVFRIWGRKWAI